MVKNNFYDEFPPEIDNLRDRAQELAKKRNDCFERSQQAFKANEKAKAKELSDEGKKYDKEMIECNKKAANLIFKLNNTDKKLPIHEIDLHGLFVEESKDFVEERIKLCKQKNIDALIIIVGRGNHSIDKIPKIKPAIEELVRIHHIEFRMNEPNEGCISLLFKKGAKIPEYGHKPNPTPTANKPTATTNKNAPKAQNNAKVSDVRSREAPQAPDNNSAAAGGCIIC